MHDVIAIKKQQIRSGGEGKDCTNCWRITIFRERTHFKRVRGDQTLEAKLIA
jgi:hypothetical protein